ncbi:MAG: NAD(P)-binding domain-containing protein [Gemmatimonadaceae bacterium]
MQALLTTVGFFALTGFFIWLHLRKGSHGAPAPQAPAKASGPPCVRCSVPVPSGSAFCPGCGIPQQIYEIVSAPTSAAEAGGDPSAAKALVRADMCVGCATCVASCPEPGAITMRGKLAVVDNALCKGHGECVAACPVGAISVTTGAAVNRVMVPQLDGNFESNVPGLFIVGELGGRGLIKNAINEGKIAVEAIARSLPPELARVDGGDDVVDVAIVGSGPAGLSAGLEALRRGLSYVVVEQGSLSDTVRKYPRHKLLLAEPVSIPLYGDLWVADASKETLLEVWETIVANTGLQVQTGQKVEQVQREGALFHIRTPNTLYQARRVVLAMGRRGTPRRLNVPGEDLAKVFYDIVEMEAFQGRRVLVVGGGDSAIESALGLANQEGAEVVLSYRGENFTRIKDRNRDKIDKAIARKRVQVIFRSEVREIRDEVVILDIEGNTTIFPNDDVIIRIGGEAPYAFLERLGVRLVHKDIPVPQAPALAG